MCSPDVPEPVKPRRQIYLFVNPSSGGRRANQYLVDVGPGDHVVEVPSATVDLHVYNIRDGDSGLKPGFVAVKKETEDSEDVVRIMVAGGDGTILWAVQELIKTGVDMNRVSIGIIPFGTGNDFSRNLGWGSDAPKDFVSKEALHRDVECWVSASTTSFDLWNIDVETHDGGGFLFVHDGKKECTESDRDQHHIKQAQEGGWRMSKPMCNYFSVGVMPRIGLGFEKKRADTKFKNLVRYFWEGTKKTFFKRTPAIADVLKHVEIHGEEDSIQRICTSSVERDDDIFYGSAKELCFINIPSFSGGGDPWKWTKKVGYQGPSGEFRGKSMAGKQQDHGDKQIEVLTWNSKIGIGVDVAKSKMWVPARGCARRFHQGSGPYVLEFKEKEAAKYEDSRGRVYFQIDGEFFVVQNPRKVAVSYFMAVNVLRNDPAFDQVKSGCCAGA